MTAPIIFAEKLCKRFPAHRKEIVDAVRDLDLEVGKGEIFGLIGPNGAGKTTAMRMLCTLLVPSSGKATVTGFDLGNTGSRGPPAHWLRRAEGRHGAGCDGA